MTKQLIEAYEEYIELLAEAGAMLMSFAYAHGWRCPEDLVERGKECRTKIADLKAVDAREASVSVADYITWEANARLIEKAPDLLAALELIASYEISDNLNYYNARRMIEIAREAIDG